MSISAQEVFARHFPGLTPEEVDAELSRTPAAGATPISSSALRHLAEHGGQEARVALESYDEATVHRERGVARARMLEELVESSWSLEETAAFMGISRSRVSHRVSARSLYAFQVGARRYVPRWQFVAAPSGGRGVEPIPGLAQVVPAIPRDLHPLAVQAFMETPQEDLGDRSPVDHLLSHAPAEVVVDLLDALGRR